MTVEVLLADDHQILREGLAVLLRHAGFEVVASVANGREAIREALARKPQVCILDLSMPEMNGLEAAREIVAKLPGVRIVVLSMHSDREYVHQAIEAGATGYVLKDAATEEVVAAARAALAGRRFVSPALQVAGARAPGRKSPLESLSKRERQVLQLLVEGRNGNEIAEAVHLSPKSVQTYRSRLMAKLGVDDLAALVKFAVRHGLTPHE